MELFASGSIALFSASLKLVDVRAIAIGLDNSGNKDVSVELGTTMAVGCFELTKAFSLLCVLLFLFFFKKGLLRTDIVCGFKVGIHKYSGLFLSRFPNIYT